MTQDIKNNIHICIYRICLLQIIFIFLFVHQKNDSLHSGAKWFQCAPLKKNIQWELLISGSLVSNNIDACIKLVCIFGSLTRNNMSVVMMGSGGTDNLSPSSLLRLSWLLFCLVLMCWQTIRCTQEFMDVPVVSKVSYQRFSDDFLPSITVDPKVGVGLGLLKVQELIKRGLNQTTLTGGARGTVQ